MATKKRPANYELKIFPTDRDITRPWYVELNYTDPVTRESCRKQYRNGINYFKTPVERFREAKNLIHALEIQLANGWSPLTDNVAGTDIETDFQSVPFNKALDIALENKKATISEKSYLDIRGVKNFAQAAAVKLRMHLMPISNTKRKHVKLLLDQIGKDRQAAYDQELELKLARGARNPKMKTWTGNSYNKYRSFLQILFSELEELEAVEFNPCMKIANKPEIDTRQHRHATEKEAEIIKSFLREHNMNFFIYLATEYMTGIRPNELFGLQVENIDWLNQCFDIQAEGGKSKTRKFRKVPIPNALMPYLEMLRLRQAAASDYIFSEGFTPGPDRNKRSYATRLWKELIKDGLGINVSLYSFKGLGGEDKRKAGVGAAAVSSQFGHSSMNMTMRYLHGEQDRINRDIIEKTPGF